VADPVSNSTSGWFFERKEVKRPVAGSKVKVSVAVSSASESPVVGVSPHAATGFAIVAARKRKPSIRGKTVGRIASPFRDEAGELPPIIQKCATMIARASDKVIGGLATVEPESRMGSKLRLQPVSV
jgi:hypothetical protein